MIPTIDFETRSAAGYVWDEEEERWSGPPGAAESGLTLVGIENYVAHPTFKVLLLSYNLFDGLGIRWWTPGLPDPTDLLRHTSRGGLIAGWNVDFEYRVWNTFCVDKFGWPPLLLEQIRCDMAMARAWGLPGSLKDAGSVLSLPVQKDADGTRLIRKFTIPRQPTKKNKELWNEPNDPDASPPKTRKIDLRPILGAEDYALKMQQWRDNGGKTDDIPF